MKSFFYPANILLPDFEKVEGEKWASVACDQYTSQKEYWDGAYRFASGSYTTLDLMLPEAYLDRESELIPEINQHMKIYVDHVLREHKNTVIYLERTQADGRVRRGLVGCVDLEDYDYSKGSETLIRATEGTVLDRIPPRARVRRNAPIELPHVMLLIDDPQRTVIEPLTASTDTMDKLYDFDLMQGGGHIRAFRVKDAQCAAVADALLNLTSKEAMEAKYGEGEAAPLLFAVGDGNHSLATAKACYEEQKRGLTEEETNEAVKSHLETCLQCRERHDAMRIDAQADTLEEKEVDYLKRSAEKKRPKQ